MIMLVYLYCIIPTVLVINGIPKIMRYMEAKKFILVFRI